MVHDSLTDTLTNMLAGYLKYRLEDMAISPTASPCALSLSCRSYTFPRSAYLIWRARLVPIHATLTPHTIRRNRPCWTTSTAITSPTEADSWMSCSLTNSPMSSTSWRRVPLQSSTWSLSSLPFITMAACLTRTTPLSVTASHSLKSVMAQRAFDKSLMISTRSSMMCV